MEASLRDPNARTVASCSLPGTAAGALWREALVREPALLSKNEIHLGPPFDAFHPKHTLRGPYRKDEIRGNIQRVEAGGPQLRLPDFSIGKPQEA